MNLEEALSDPIWKDHKVGDIYYLVHSNGKKEEGWKISYYPLSGTYQEVNGKNEWVDFNEPRVLIERKTYFKAHKEWGIDFREIPIRFLEKQNK